MMKFGDLVRTEILDERAGSVGFGYVIGVPGYSRGFDDVVVVADGDYLGCPINARWCTRTGESDVQKAVHLRERYDSKFQGFLKKDDVPLGSNDLSAAAIRARSET